MMPAFKELDNPRISALGITGDDMAKYAQTVESGASRESALQAMLVGRLHTDEDAEFLRWLLKDFPTPA